MKRGSIRPGGRTERVRQSVANAVLQLIKDGKTDFTITDVAECSGIARSTIYARWPGREQLLAEALRSHNAEFQIDFQDRDWRVYMHHIAFAFRDFSAKPDEIAINSLAAQLGAGFLAEETHRQWRSISKEMAAPLRTAQQAGEIRSEIDPIIVISTLFTSIAGHIVIAKDVPSDQHLNQIVRMLISGCEAV